MTHILKIWPQYFQRVIDGAKTFEVRKNDRDYQTGDYVILEEWDPETKKHSGRSSQTFKIGYVYKLDWDDLVVFSLIREEPLNLEFSAAHKMAMEVSLEQTPEAFK